jgi:hypothetical protein
MSKTEITEHVRPLAQTYSALPLDLFGARADGYIRGVHTPSNPNSSTSLVTDPRAP